MEKERTQSWLEARRELLVQLRGSEYADGIKETTGVWFGSVEWEIGWALYSESVALNIKVDRQGLDALIQVRLFSLSFLVEMTTERHMDSNSYPISTQRYPLESLPCFLNQNTIRLYKPSPSLWLPTYNRKRCMSNRASGT